VTLGGIKMENVMYERMPLKVKLIDGKGSLEMSLGKDLRFPSRYPLRMFVPSQDTIKSRYACNMLGGKSS